jgi:hypothetical protein
MAVIPTPENAKPIADFETVAFDGNSLLFHSNNGHSGKADADTVANYVAVNKVYTGLGGKTIPQAIGKQISGTLTAGSTTITLSDASITTSSWVKPYASVWGVLCTNMVISTGSVALTFEAQASDITVGVEVR